MEAITSKAGLTESFAQEQLRFRVLRTDSTHDKRCEFPFGYGCSAISDVDFFLHISC
jgi:hypothetical protein